MREYLKTLTAPIIVTVALIVCVVAYASMLHRFFESKSGQTEIDETTIEGFGSTMIANSMSFQFHQSQSGDDLGGQSYLKNCVINWKSESRLGDDDGTTPKAVLAALISRLSFLQNTVQASDQNAKALFALTEAYDLLTGKELPELSTIHKE